MNVTRTADRLTYLVTADMGRKWHRGCSSIPDKDGTSKNSRHHPVLNEIGDGWMWLKDYNTNDVWWIHETGLHICLKTGYGSLWENKDLWPELARVLNKAIANKLTGFHKLEVTDGNLELK